MLEFCLSLTICNLTCDEIDLKVSDEVLMCPPNKLNKLERE